MNLGQIIDRVQAELQHQVPAARARLDYANVINAEYLALMESKVWDFRVTESSIRVYADYAMSGELTLASRAMALDDDFRMLCVDGLLLLASDEDGTLRKYGRLVGPAPVNWGTVFERTDYAPGLDGFPGDPDTATSGGPLCYLEDAAAATVATTTWTVRRDRYILPHDCSEVLAVVARDAKRGPLQLISRAAERMRPMSTNQDSAGIPAVAIMDDPIPPIPAPSGTLVATVTGNAGFLAVGRYRYFCAYHYDGRFSARTNIAEVNVTAADGEVGLSGLVQHNSVDSAYQRTYWRETSYLSNRWEYIGKINAGSGDFGDDSAPPEVDSATLRPLVWSDAMAGQRQAIRFWPRPSTTEWLDIAYLRSPSRLVGEQDVPDMPENFHELIVDLAVVALAGRNGADKLEKSAAARANQKLAAMSRRWLTKVSTSTSNAGWSPFGRGGRGAVSITWND